MERVRARTADHVDLAAGDSAVLRRQNALDDLDLRHGFNAHHRDLPLAAVLAHSARFGIGRCVRAVHRDERATLGHTVDPNVTLSHWPPPVEAMRSPVKVRKPATTHFDCLWNSRRLRQYETR